MSLAGSDLLDWLQQRVEGLQERRPARKYASSLLKAGYIRHTVNKATFSEQCYYVFGDYTGGGNRGEFLVCVCASYLLSACVVSERKSLARAFALVEDFFKNFQLIS